MKKEIKELKELKELLSQKFPQTKLITTLCNCEFDIVINCKNFAELIKILKTSVK